MKWKSNTMPNLEIEHTKFGPILVTKPYEGPLSFIKRFHALDYSMSFLSAGFDLYELDGKTVFESNIAPHHMSVVDIKRNDLIVHSWGEELIYKEKYLWLISSVTAVKNR